MPKFPKPATEAIRVLPSLVYLALCRSFELLALLTRGDTAKDLEILVLRHQLTVLQRQTSRPKLEPADRALLAAISRVLPRNRWSCFFVTPETLRRWHRCLVARAMAEQLLAGDPILGVPPGDVERFMTAAYRRRNAEIHGDHPTTTTMRLLDGATTDKLAVLVEDLARVLGRATQLVLIATARPASD